MSASDRDDVVARAARSLRAEQDAAIAAAGGPAAFVPVDPTWSRIARDVRRGRERRRIAAVVAVQLAIGLGAVGVWAAVSKRLTPVVAPPAVPVQPPCEPPPARHRSTAVVAAPAVEPSAPESEPAPAPRRSAPVRGVAHLESTARAAAGTAATQGGRADVGAAALYRDAHELHFVRRDFARALAAWDRYLLTSAPLAIEARYNRAIALAHLGRRDEAVAALHPFAEGELGSYRRAEARALIDKLRSD